MEVWSTRYHCVSVSRAAGSLRTRSHRAVIRDLCHYT